MHFLIKFDDLKNLSIKQANTFKSEDDFPPRHTSNLYFFANVALLLFLKQLFFYHKLHLHLKIPLSQINSS